MLQCKSDAFEAFKHFKNLAETKKGMKVKTLRLDRGGEFTSDEFTNYCLKHGIKRQLTAPYSPQQNGVVERKNRTAVSDIAETSRSLKHELAYQYSLISQITVKTSIEVIRCRIHGEEGQ